MTQLTQTQCVACDINAKRLTTSEIELLMPQVQGWDLIEGSGAWKLQRIFLTQHYEKSMALTNAIAELAQSEDHHPLIIVEYGRVTVQWWSHKIKGLHQNDFVMAAKTSEIEALGTYYKE